MQYLPKVEFIPGHFRKFTVFCLMCLDDGNETHISYASIHPHMQTGAVNTVEPSCRHVSQLCEDSTPSAHIHRPHYNEINMADVKNPYVLTTSQARLDKSD